MHVICLNKTLAWKWRLCAYAMFLILEYVWMLSCHLLSHSMVFNAMTYRKKRMSIMSDFGLEFLLASTCKIGTIFFLIFVKTLKFFIVINSCRYIRYSLHYVKFCIWLLSAVWAVIILFISCLFLFLPWQIILSPKKIWILWYCHTQSISEPNFFVSLYQKTF